MLQIWVLGINWSLRGCWPQRLRPLLTASVLLCSCCGAANPPITLIIDWQSLVRRWKPLVARLWATLITTNIGWHSCAVHSVVVLVRVVRSGRWRSREKHRCAYGRAPCTRPCLLLLVPPTIHSTTCTVLPLVGSRFRCYHALHSASLNASAS